MTHADPSGWATTWAAAAVNQAVNGPRRIAPTTFDGETLCMVVRVSAGGSWVRIRLSNTFGTQPVRIGSARVERCDANGCQVPGQDARISFGGSSSVVIPMGASSTSDPAELQVNPLGYLRVSLHFPGFTGPATLICGPATVHKVFRKPGEWDGGATNDLDTSEVPEADLRQTQSFLTAIQVERQTGLSHTGILVFGDSIASGRAAEPAAEQAWVARLARRFLEEKRQSVAVATVGIRGNRLLHHGVGDSGLSRFVRDVLSHDGVTHVIEPIGVNDLHFWHVFGKLQKPTADRLIKGKQSLIDLAHERGLRIVGATILPFEGMRTEGSAWTDEMEAVRQEVNRWVRQDAAYDGFIDFDQALRDPQQPSRLAFDYDCGDGLHPGNRGHAAMAAAINLNFFKVH